MIGPNCLGDLLSSGYPGPEVPARLTPIAADHEGRCQSPSLLRRGFDARACDNTKFRQKKMRYHAPMDDGRLTALALHVVSKALSSPDARRFILGITGPPAAGKSTLAGRLVNAINSAAGSTVAAAVPMMGSISTTSRCKGWGLPIRRVHPKPSIPLPFFNCCVTFERCPGAGSLSRLTTGPCTILNPMRSVSRKMSRSSSQKAIIYF